MLDDTKHLKELAQATSVKLNLNQFFIEKDFYVTRAIHALTRVKDEYFALIFQGGTSLSKGYQVVQRLSEDIDFRVIQKPSAIKLGKNVRRKKLRDFRYALVKALQDAAFKIPENAVKVFYEGQFMSIQAEFADSEKLSYLKPHIAIECFLGELALESTTTNITTLIKVTLGEECEHSSFPVTCVALDETAAEKWVALTRRVANAQIKSRNSDKHLVRHLYDLYHLKTGDLLSGKYTSIIRAIMQKDGAQFKKYNTAYATDPLDTSKSALVSLLKDQKWREHWDYFLEQMVYDENKLEFNKAYEQPQEISQNIFKTLKNN